ncbi:hypothetical protein JAAARDRAFT_178355 [Jaapia argillacea MUCL 33604]|uniref:Pre-mRNA-splicing factor SLU7 n=1 Tax=Jaapia argillacea MUCL 33604 TaxID=933084 RepID=A0A067Q5H0_9AGAM|nr:hypothetical protein JAAARDRAFT_178355 [Jaapia argillacea MUCL 33604]
MASASATGKLSREEFRRQKELDAARKAGTAPAALDEEGKPINPHIPQYIAQAPWYLDTGAPTLAHQRRPDEQPAAALNNWYDRGAKAGPAAKKYRKGACENCGAMSHKKQDCLERPRKKGAKYTNRDIQADEVIQEVSAGYDAKRDRWNGYDSAEYKQIYDEYTALEAARQKLREEEIDKQTTTDFAAVRKVAKAGKGEGKAGGDDDFGSSDEDEEDEEKYADAADAVGQKVDTKTRITVRNLRIREDTAKYLLSLDPESAYYDPKTRSMRDAPVKTGNPEDLKFAGENFLRHSGEAPDVQNLQLFAWQSQSHGGDVHLNANPTAGELLHREYQTKKEELKGSTKTGILAKYGGEEYLGGAPKELLRGQTEEYVEYSREGKVVKGKERVKVRSKYAEDVWINNHTAVWGSWFDAATGLWGYACCHSTIHVSYCSGEAGIEAALASSAQHLLASASTFASSSTPSSSATASTSKPFVDPYGEPAESKEKGDDRKKRADRLFSKERLGEGEVKLDESRLAKAISEERKRKMMRGEDDGDEDEGRGGKKKKAGGTYEVTEEELEAYRMTRRMTEDPMANYVDTDV